ncbi:hypothetical protein CCUS01_06010 [Colletotrichum cuscutae]|uniref:Uncharacterized protein n=1 Tax=Colletotrichum cuscutae TaxID=1209917 RepID=A0AAI9V682_9PEZI|nr:hypothetical protein CCUS01_06010 [Colletotrichum cuscutae]
MGVQSISNYYVHGRLERLCIVDITSRISNLYTSVHGEVVRTYLPYLRPASQWRKVEGEAIAQLAELGNALVRAKHPSLPMSPPRYRRPLRSSSLHLPACRPVRLVPSIRMMGVGVSSICMLWPNPVLPFVPHLRILASRPVIRANNCNDMEDDAGSPRVHI